MTTAQEIELINKLKARDHSAFEHVVRSHTKHIFRASLGLGFSEEEADDLTQSVWDAFFKAVENFSGNSSIRTFLFGILYNKAHELRRQKSRLEPKEDIDAVVDSYFDSSGKWIMAHVPVQPDRFFESCETLDIISKCLELLPLKQRMAFLLKEVEEEVTETICNAMSVSASNLGVLLFRARNQLR
ncbi:sigma-70 family RNA polymerase sigma factor, partial [bacterium]|nr:sigma-70 family RNA polymerase sigma factor [bacterium]